MIESSQDLKQTPGSNVTTKCVTMKLPSMLENDTFANEFLIGCQVLLVVEEVQIMQSK